ncbi:MAG: WGR domain-containing protein [Stutzerimonas stutzeri]|nr:MAG: WGR domain-containing protein [Stutzerimonas stutzeri]
MLAQPYQLYVERTDNAKNMSRFYAMSIEETLFGQACLVRRWGRIGARGQVMQHSFEREDEAVRLFLDLLQQKRKKGYRPSIGDGDAGSPIVASRKPTPPGGGAG